MKLAIRSLVGAGLLALGMVAGAAAPASAGAITPVPIAVPQPNAPVPQVTLVQDGAEYWRRHHRRDRWKNGEWRDTRVIEPRDRWHRRDRWRDGRRHWRHHDRWRRGPVVYFDFEVPVRRYVEPRRYRVQGLTRAHLRWCEDRYRSYRAWDNTFQPNRGPRRECISPYI